MSTKVFQVVGSLIQTDTTLSVEGVAADAKVVGDALAEKQPVGDYATNEYVNAQIAAIPTPDVSGQISTHNTATDAHSDIRSAISDLDTLVGDTAVATQISNAVGAITPSSIGAAASSHSHAAGDVTSGTFDAARIPSLAASKITSGTFAAARIPSLAASKISAGTLAGKVQANATAAATLANAQVRDIIISTTDLTAGTSTLATGTVYLVYE